MNLNNARLSLRLALAFGAVCFVMSLAAGVGIWRLMNLQDIADDLGARPPSGRCSPANSIPSWS